ncbi:MAG: hypothetical protein EA369_06160 [Bradymonadales bacterium]|nr:MAG: hypothetical protein EA369_06160 [Bradymonadales bacterium]
MTVFRIQFLFLFLVSVSFGSAKAENLQREKDRQAILGMSGCYMVDYNYHEVEALLEGYQLDHREYHASVNSDFQRFVRMYPLLDSSVTPENYQLNVKEKIWVRTDEENVIHLQHIIFLTNKKGELDFVMKHHSQRWRYEADRTYTYSGGMLWEVENLEDTAGRWTREVKALDDSPRYSCTGAWEHSQEFPRWECSNYSPIPGREYRDMGRRDYQGLDRTHRITVYPYSWLDAQENVKVREQNGERIDLARELGRNWHHPLPEGDCSVVDSFVEERSGFWSLTQEVWDEFLQEGRSMYESTGRGIARWMPINGGPLIVHPDRKLVQYRTGLEQEYLDASERDERLFAGLKMRIRKHLLSYDRQD